MVTFLSRSERMAWRIAQMLVFALGLAILVALIFWPEIGLAALWNVLIPVAPALLVFGPGLWRNVCPLASAALFSRHMEISARRRLSINAQGWLTLAGLALLLLIVPLRHAFLNVNGPATAVVLGSVGLLSVIMGFAFEWKSGWCSGLCPVHPVEKLYGSRPALTVRNAHCTQCQRCTAVCPDSTVGMHPLRAPATKGHAIAGAVLVGGFPGYVWGWFQISDHVGGDWAALARAFGIPFVAMGVTFVLYIGLRRIISHRRRDLLIRFFATAAVCCYYWYRLPMLLGLGPYPGEGALVDLAGVLPATTAWALRVTTTALFIWWMLGRPARRRAWTVRPPFADRLGPEIALVQAHATSASGGALLLRDEEAFAQANSLP